MKKYLKRGLTVLTCAAMCIQSPLITMAEEIQRTNGEASAYQADNYGVATQAQKEPQWIKDSAGWWYQNADGSYPRNQWKMINGSWYHFDWNGYMQTGWQKIGGSWYYLNAGGDMRTGWLQSGNVWYYLKSSGAMAIGWEKIGSDWYYLNSSGAMQTGWLQLGNTWYYLKSSGAMAINEWVDGGAYYVDANGVYIPEKKQESTETPETKPETKPGTNNKEDLDKPEPKPETKPEPKPETKPETNNKEDSDKPESKPEHEHKYDIELSHIVHHEATGHDEQYVVKEAWDEEVTTEEEYAWSCCNVCGADCTDNPSEHMFEHALAYEGGGWHTEYGTRLVTTTVHHDAIYGTRWVQDSEAYDEKVIDGYACSCGAKK
mgnify:FL=1